MPKPYALIVDDSPTSRDIFRTILEHGGFRVRTVADGNAALETVEAEPPDVVILDLFLPCVDGFEILERLRSNDRTRGIAVVCITAGATDEVRDRAEALGCDALAFKPEGPREVLRLVQGVLGRRVGGEDA
ncbi:MAG: PleD family two-component system response regulator [Gemmatimonadota bacterium]